MEFTRFRETGSLEAIESGYWLRYWPNTCPGSWGPSVESVWSRSDARFGRKRTIADTVTPGYHKLRQKGGYVGTNYLRTTDRTVAVSGGGTVVTHHPTVKPCGTAVDYERLEASGRVMPALLKSINSSYSPTRVIDGGRTENVVTEAITRTMARRQAGDANLIESLAEADQAWRLVGHPLENLGRFAEEFAASRNYRRFEKLRKKYPDRWTGLRWKPRGIRPIRRGTMTEAMFNELQELARLSSSEYLRWRYGVSPLISDVQAGMKTLKKIYDKNAQPTLHTARAEIRLFDSGVTTWDLNPAAQSSHNVSRADSHEFSVRAYWHDAYAATAFNELGITFHNVVAVPWELLRLSFVLDWFANVGDLIYANIPRVGVSPLGGGYTCYEVIQNTYRHAGYSARAPTIEYFVGSWGDQVSITYKEKLRRGIDREKMTGLVIKDNFRLDNWTRASDLVAIVYQQLIKVAF